MTVRTNLNGYGGPIEQLESLDFRIEGLASKNKIIFTFGFILDDFSHYPDPHQVQITERKTIIIPRKNDLFKNEGRNARVLVRAVCREERYDKKRVDRAANLLLTSVDLGYSLFYAFRAECDVENRAKRLEFRQINRNTFELTVQFNAAVPVKLQNKITKLIIRVRSFTAVYPPYVLTKFRGDKSHIYAREFINTPRKYNPFDEGLTVTAEFQCKDETSQGKNLSTFNFQIASSEFDQRYFYRALGTCGIQRKARFRKAGTFSS